MSLHRSLRNRVQRTSPGFQVGPGGRGRTALSDPILGQIPGLEEILANYGLLLQISSTSPEVSPSTIMYQNTWAHGYGIMDVSSDAFTIILQEISSDEIGTSYYDNPEALNDLFTTLMFTIRDGVLAPGP